MWAVDHAGVTPDLLCIAKTIGGGLPLSMVSYREDLPKKLPPGFHLGTYRGNPLALAVGTEVLKVLHEQEWASKTARRGARLKDRFQEIANEFPGIGQVRGKGFMIGAEFVKDPSHRAPWGDGANQMRRALFGRGVLMHTCGPYDQVLRFMAPLIIEDELLDRGLEIFEEALQSLGGTPTPLRPPPIAGSEAPSHPELSRPAHLPAPSHPHPSPPPPGRSLP